MRWTVLTSVLILSLLSAVTLPQQPAAAQLLPPNRGAVSFNFATFNPTLYSFGLVYPVAPVWDATFSYSWQSAAGVTASLTSLGARYHFALENSPRVAPYVGAGFASVGTSISGFGAANASGLFLTTGASVQFESKFTGYGSLSLFSIGGTSSNVIDLGVQFSVAPTFSAQIGYVNFAGSSAPYVGVTISLPQR